MRRTVLYKITDYENKEFIVRNRNTDCFNKALIDSKMLSDFCDTIGVGLLELTFHADEIKKIFNN